MSRDRIMNPSPFPVSITGQQVVTTPYVIRDSVVTAYVAYNTGTKTELVAGVSGYYLDLMQISMSNSSGAVQAVTLFDESTTVQVFNLPANTGSGIVYTFPVPLRQSAKGVSWYVDKGDVTDSTVNIQALFIKTQS